MSANVGAILIRERTLRGQSDNWLSYYQDLADFVLPRKAWITSPKYHGERLDFNYLYDSTAIRSLKIMGAGFHSNMTNPSTKWFRLQCWDQKLNENREVQRYWYDVAEVVFTILRASNFDTEMQEFYSDYGCFGIADICTIKDHKTKLRFQTIPVEQCMVEEDANKRVCAVYRKFILTAGQAYMLWGINAGKSVLDKIKDDKLFDEMEFLWYVGPRERRDFSKIDNLNKPYESVWIAMKDQHIMDESGFDELPHHVGRFWKEANDPRGTSPAMDVLCDVRLKNVMKKTSLRAAMKNADPALSVPDKGFIAPINMNPGAINYRHSKTQSDSIQPMPAGAGNYHITELEIQETKMAIEEGFYVPLFRALSAIDKQMTIPEVQRRVLENMILLGPVVGRCQHEVLDPMITRLCNEAGRQGMLPKLPDILRGKDYGPVYMGPLAKAQRASAVGDIQGFLQAVGNMAQFDPNVMDKVDLDKSIDLIADLMGVNPQILKEQQKIDEIRKKRQALANQQMQLQMAGAGAEVAETTGKAKKHMAQAESK